MLTKKVLSDRTEWRDENNKLHRENGPAIEWANGINVWYLNGLCHRVDGPAIENFIGYKAWYLNGIRYTEEEHALLTWEFLTQDHRDDIIFGQSDVD